MYYFENNFLRHGVHFRLLLRPCTIFRLGVGLLHLEIKLKHRRQEMSLSKKSGNSVVSSLRSETKAAISSKRVVLAVMLSACLRWIHCKFISILKFIYSAGRLF